MLSLYRERMLTPWSLYISIGLIKILKKFKNKQMVNLKLISNDS